MNDRLFNTLLKRYEAEIEDALYKLQCIEKHDLVIPAIKNLLYRNIRILQERLIPCWVR